MRKSALVLFLVPASLAAQPAPPAAPLVSELAPLQFLAGSCWRASFPNSSATDTHCFTSIMGGHFLRDRHVVAGAPDPYWGETIYRWDANARRIQYDYYASDGSHSAGTAQSAAGGLTFLDEHRSAGAAATQIRSSWTREGDDTYVAVAETRSGDSWRELFRLRFTRIAPSPAD